MHKLSQAQRTSEPRARTVTQGSKKEEKRGLRVAFWKQVKKDLKGTILEVGQGDQVQMQTGALSQGLQQEIGSEEQQC